MTKQRLPINHRKCDGAVYLVSRKAWRGISHKVQCENCGIIGHLDANGAGFIMYEDSTPKIEEKKQCAICECEIDSCELCPDCAIENDPFVTSKYAGDYQ